MSMLGFLGCLAFAGLAMAAYFGVIASERRFAREREAWRDERQELLNRIQAPDRIPVRDMPGFVIPERVPDEWASVGEISIDPEYGLSDEDDG
jgi:hypothetical protein